MLTHVPHHLPRSRFCSQILSVLGLCPAQHPPTHAIIWRTFSEIIMMRRMSTLHQPRKPGHVWNVVARSSEECKVTLLCEVFFDLWLRSDVFTIRSRCILFSTCRFFYPTQFARNLLEKQSLLSYWPKLTSFRIAASIQKLKLPLWTSKPKWRFGDRLQTLCSTESCNWRNQKTAFCYTHFGEGPAKQNSAFAMIAAQGFLPTLGAWR